MSDSDLADVAANQLEQRGRRPFGRGLSTDQMADVIRAVYSEQTAKLASLRDALPATGDGVPITPRMSVWLPEGTPLYESKQDRTNTTSQWIVNMVDLGMVGVYLAGAALSAVTHPENCYSTRDEADKNKRLTKTSPT